MKRGFFFSLTSIILFLYVVLVVTVNVATINQISETYREMISILSYRDMYASFSNETMSRFLGDVTYFAMYKLANHTVENPIVVYNGYDHPDYWNAVVALKELINNGEVDGRYFTTGRGIKYTDEEMGATFSSVREKLNKTLAERGYVLKSFEISNLAIDFSTYKSIIVKANVSIEISDSFGKTGINYTTELSSLVNLSGIPDPMVNRYLKSVGAEGFREIWFVPDDVERRNSNDIPQASRIFLGSRIEAGQGWFYGPIISTEDANSKEFKSLPSDKKYLYILAGTFEDIKDVPDYEDYGAYIILGNIQSSTDRNGCIHEVGTFNALDQTYSGGRCVNGVSEPTDRPFIVLNFASYDLFNRYLEGINGGIGAKGKSMSEGRLVNPFYSRKAILFVTDEIASPENVRDNPELKDATTSNPTIYNMEDIRDYTACQHYFHTKLIDGPNIFQRMLEAPWDHVDEKNGFISLLVGEPYGGGSLSNVDDFSNVDVTFVKQYFLGRCSVTDEICYIKGMPGVKSEDMFNIDSPIGKFSMTEDEADSITLGDDRLCIVERYNCGGGSK